MLSPSIFQVAPYLCSAGAVQLLVYSGTFLFCFSLYHFAQPGEMIERKLLISKYLAAAG
jgi:hypothetical protein